MSLRDIAQWLNTIQPEHAPEALAAIRGAVLEYRPATRVELLALEEVCELAQKRFEAELAARGFE